MGLTDEGAEDREALPPQATPGGTPSADDGHRLARALFGSWASTMTEDGPGADPPTLDPVPARPRNAHALPQVAADRYVIGEELGRGGMGVIHRAYDRVLHRTVALKLLHSSTFCTADEVERFCREARAASSLDHPHVVRVFDFGELASTEPGADGRPFISMEYTQGGTLGIAIQEGGLSYSELASVLCQVAEAAFHAHLKGILHRDIKPSNIFLKARDSRDGELHALLLDFGVAKLVGGQGQEAAPPATSRASSWTMTNSGQLLGTPAYMAPEQVRGARTVDGRADVYSLGATLYHALTGRPPFAAKTVGETLHAILSEEPIPPRVLRPEVPKPLETICLKCLEKDPARRYATAADLAEDARRFIGGERIVARRPGLRAHARKWAGRHPLWAVLLTLVLVLLPLAAYRYARPRRIRIETDPPDARITLDGWPIGMHRWILPGPHHVRCEAEGCFPREFWIELLPLETEDLGHVKLHRDHGWFDLDSDPSGAAVWMDGVDTRMTTPARSVPLRVGRHVIDLVLPGHERASRAVEMRSEARLDLGRLPLEPDRRRDCALGGGEGVEPHAISDHPRSEPCSRR